LSRPGNKIVVELGTEKRVEGRWRWRGVFEFPYLMVYSILNYVFAESGVWSFHSGLPP